MATAREESGAGALASARKQNIAQVIGQCAAKRGWQADQQFDKQVSMQSSTQLSSQPSIRRKGKTPVILDGWRAFDCSADPDQ